MRADVILCSPPYADLGDGVKSGKVDESKWTSGTPGRKMGSSHHRIGYGYAIGQLGAMRPGDTPEGSMIDTIEPVEWVSCYDDNWKGIISEASFAHPAKMARGLVARIFDHLFATGRIRRGSLVVDPFGGIGTTAIEGASRGCKVVCCELEEKFYKLMLGNFDLHRKTWEAFGDPLPVAVNGDSRNLVALLGPVIADCVVSSPPYAEGEKGHPSLGSVNKDEWGTDGRNIAGRRGLNGVYGTTEGQLGALAAGSVEAVLSREADCVLSSPPFADSVAGRGQDELTKSKGMGHDYDERGEFDKRGFLMGKEEYEKYAETCNLGSFRECSPTFWQAARVIVSQSFAILRPGGCAVWICKDFVRAKKRVPFSADWARLCQSCGFVLVEWIKASLVKRTAEASLFGGEEVDTTERKSFFRRLAEKKGSPRIDEEDVLVFVKPDGTGNGADCVVSSPPYAEALSEIRESRGPGQTSCNDKRKQGERYTADGASSLADYGSTAGQLGSMPPGNIEDAL